MKKTIALLTAGVLLTAALPGLPAARAAAAGLPANPVISRNQPAFSGSSTNAKDGNDDFFYTSWKAKAPDFLAYDLSAVPADQRGEVIAVWYTLSTFDNIGSYVNRNAEPIDYVIEVNAAPGGECPADGWKTVKTVTDNGLSSRQCVVDMTGNNWIRLRVTKALGDSVDLNFDVHDASGGVCDSWLFLGDSITAGGMVNAWGTSYAAFVNSLDSNYFPVAENGGIGGISSYHGKDAIDSWLADSSAHFVSLAYGTNDSWGNQTGPDRYYDCEKYIIDAILAAGKVPVLPTIPYSTNTDVNTYLPQYQAKIQQLYEEYGEQIVHGPDFNSFFAEHPEFLSGDGVHPSSEGYEEMRQLWAETMYKNVYTAEAAPVTPNPGNVRGDVNKDGKFNIADAVMLHKYLLKRITDLPDWKAGDMDSSGTLTAADLTLMKRELTPSSTTER